MNLWSSIVFVLCLLRSVCFSQNDSLNQVDENGLKQGCWIVLGKDRPQTGFLENGKIEEGTYAHNKKEGFLDQISQRRNHT